MLRGAARTLERHRPTVVLEHSSNAAHFGTRSETVHELLAGAGLRVFDIDGNGPVRTGRARGPRPLGRDVDLRRPPLTCRASSTSTPTSTSTSSARTRAARSAVRGAQRARRGAPAGAGDRLRRRRRAGRLRGAPGRASRASTCTRRASTTRGSASFAAEADAAAARFETSDIYDVDPRGPRRAVRPRAAEGHDRAHPRPAALLRAARRVPRPGASAFLASRPGRCRSAATSRSATTGR